MIEVRDLRAEDKEKIRNWRNSPDISKNMLTDQYISPEDHEKWFARIMADPTVRYWMIMFDGQDVGLCNLDQIDEQHRRCSWGFYIADEAGKGIGGIVENFVLRYVFEDLRLNKLYGEVLATNQRMLALHKFFGLTVEGCLRQHVIKDGVPTDIYCVAMLREEWESRNRRPEAS